MLESVCIYCGSNFGTRDGYLQAAQNLCIELVQRQITIVYGGGNTGLMGAVADFALSAGGKVVGVIPQFLVDREVAHTGLSDLKIVKSMHERKLLMSDLSDAFIGLPGGLGTLEEFCEVATWTQLGVQRKACGLLNVEGFYDKFLYFLDHATEEKFIRPEHRKIFIAEEDPVTLVSKLDGFEMTILPKSINQEQL